MYMRVVGMRMRWAPFGKQALSFGTTHGWRKGLYELDLEGFLIFL